MDKYINIHKYINVHNKNKQHDIIRQALDEYNNIISKQNEELVKLIIKPYVKNNKKKATKFMDIYAKYEFPYWYINFLEHVDKLNPDTLLVKFSSPDEIENDLKFVKNRPLKHLILMAKYSGMGYYYVLSVLFDEFKNNEKDIFFIHQIGGSNYLDQQQNFDEFNSLKDVDLNNFDEALAKLKYIE